MAIAHHIREIGRGAAGARSLGVDAAQALMGAVLDGQATDLEVGAFVLAMRMKGESVEELVGFLAAAEARLAPIHSDRPVVVIPSYNGARRLPNLTPLLAMALAQADARVLVHGQATDPTRVTSLSILRDLGLPAAHGEGEVHAAWARHEPAVVETATLSAPLQRLLDVRWTVGVRNSGHTIAKMLQPCTGARALRLASYTHPEFGALMSGWAQRERVDAMVLRGTEGEAVADPRRQPRLDTYVGGQLSEAWSVPAQDGVVATLPVLPPAIDAATTARYIQAVLAGEQPMPAPLARQVEAIVGALAELDAPRPADGTEPGQPL